MKRQRRATHAGAAWALAVLGALAAPAVRAQNLFGTTDAGDGVRVFDRVTGALLSEFVAGGAGGLQASTGIALGPDANIYVASSLTDSILVFDGGTGSYLGDFVDATSGVRGPMDIEFGPDGNLYVASRFTHEIVRFDGTTGAFLDAFVPYGEGGLYQPEAFEFGPDGNLYVASSNTDSILRFDGLSGAFLGEFVVAGAGGLSYPSDLKFGRDGRLYVSSYFGDAVLRYDGATGAFLDEFVSPAEGVVEPAGLAFDPAGDLYVSSYGTDEVLRFDGNGARVGVFATSTPALAFIAFVARPALQSIVITPDFVAGGCTNSTATVTLDRAAPSGGARVGLTTDIPSISIPTSVTIAAGATSASFTVTTRAVSSSQFGRIFGSYGGARRDDTMSIRPIQISGLSISPNSVLGGQSSTGTATLECAAGPTDLVVALSSDKPAVASVPSSVTVRLGSTSASFPVTTTAQAADVTAFITGSLAGASRSNQLLVKASSGIHSVSVSPGNITGSLNGTGTVSLTSAAGPGGVTVSVATDKPAVATPASSEVFIAEGQTSASFAVNTFYVTATTTVKITATLGASVKSNSFNVNPVRPKRLSLSKSAVVGGTSLTGTVTLETAAGPSDIVVTLATDNGSVAAPTVSSITIPAGSTSGTFTIQTFPVSSSTNVRLSASANGGTASATLRVDP